MDIDPAEDRVLAQPTRARLFRMLADDGPAATEDLAATLDRHPNGIRIHLEKLRRAGLVASVRERRGRGRPRDLWSIDPAADPGGSGPTAYRDLSKWLAGAISDGPAGPEHIERRGREVGNELARRGSTKSNPLTRFQNALAAMGFQPGPATGSGPQTTFRLGNCPYREVARENSELVCGLHRGITEGFLEQVDPGSSLTRFEAKDPDQAGCLIGVRFARHEPGV